VKLKFNSSLRNVWNKIKPCKWAFLSTLIIAQTTFAQWDGSSADIGWYTEREYELTISTPQQLAGLAKLVAMGKTFEERTIILEQDVYLENHEWTPIGTRDNPFCGTFDGRNYVIRGVYIYNSEEYQGLFGYVDNNGTIRNLGVEDSQIRSDYNYVGGLVAYLNNGEISDSHFSGTVNGGDDVGGLIGHFNNGTISNSYFTGTVEGRYNVGGLTGYISYGTINSSRVDDAEVTGQENVGGLVGHFNGGEMNGINDDSSYFNGKVEGQKFTGTLLGLLNRDNVNLQ
jgi:hypothetical protein